MSDVIVIGGGTAGLTAAIFIQRSAMESIVLESEEFGGRIFPTLAIDNYPGMPGVTGVEYSETLRAQAKSLGAQLVAQTAYSITLSGAVWQVKTQERTHEAQAVIYAAGEKQRFLGVPGEKEFLGRGVASCAACDGAFFRNETVAIVGGGDKALDDALTLSRLCASVHLIHRRDEFRAAGGTVAKVKATQNIKFHLNCNVTSINGDRRVDSVSVLGTDGKIETLAVSGVFVAVGSDPQSALCAQYAQIDSEGYIVADEDCKTSTPGLLVAGDVRQKPFRQLVTAAADGAVAANGAVEYIVHKKWKGKI